MEGDPLRAHHGAGRADAEEVRSPGPRLALVSRGHFARRLTEETGTLRVEMARTETRLIAWMCVLWLGQIGALVTLLR